MFYVPPLTRTKKKSKFRNTKCKAQGEKFDSIGERDRWFFLEAAQREGKIRNLERQVKFEMIVNGEHICDMKPDYAYEIAPSWEKIISDFKGGYKLPADWTMKRKLLKALYGVEIYIVKSPTEPLKPEAKKGKKK